MLLTFKTKAYANITMLGDVGTRLLEMMNFGTNVPGAIDADDLPTALDNLKQALNRLPEQVDLADDADDDQPSVSIHTRVIPLIKLLQAAIDEEEYIRWE